MEANRWESKRLFELARASTKSARQVAKNESAPPDLLWELASCSDVTTRKNVAANPNTPTEVLFELGAQFPEQLFDNPVFPLLLLENPNLVAEMPLRTLRSILKLERIPVSFLEWGAKSSDEEVLLAVATNVLTPRAILEKLLESRYKKVKEASRLHVNLAGEMTEGWNEAALRAIQTTAVEKRDEVYLVELAQMGLIPEFVVEGFLKYRDNCEAVLEAIALFANTSSSWIVRLSRDPHWKVRSAVANNCHTPSIILSELARDEIANVRASVALNPNTPVRIIQQLGRDENADVRTAVAQNSHTPSKILEELSRDNYLHMGKAIAQNPQTPSRILQELALNDRADVRISVVQNPNTPVKIREKLARDKNIDVRAATARNPHTPAKVLELLARDKNWQIRVSVAVNSNTPRKVLVKLAEDNNNMVREFVALNPNTHVSLLEQLALDIEVDVRSALAFNRNTPVSLLEQLAADTTVMVREFVALNSNTPASILTQLARDATIEMRQNLARNTNTPLSVLKQILKSSDRRIEVKDYLDRNPDALPLVLEHYAKDFISPFSRLVVLLHPQTPARVFAENFRSSVWIQRYAIAQNPKTPMRTIKALAEDANRIVRAAARANLQSRHLSAK